jgi:hypothetical protein
MRIAAAAPLFSAVVFVASATSAAAQELVIPDAQIPTLPASAATIEGFVPPGWAVEARAAGDLDGDGVQDAALVLHGKDAALVVDSANYGPPQLDTNPRVLAVVFGRSAGGYRLGLQNATLIPRRTEPNMDDPFDSVTGGGLSVQGQSIRVQLGLFMSAGGWGMFNVTYTFRWQHDRLEMIGYDRNDTQRNTGDIRSVSINYSTGKAKISTGNIESDEDKVEWKTLPDRRRLSIEEIGDGLEFNAGFDE